LTPARGRATTPSEPSRRTALNGPSSSAPRTAPSSTPSASAARRPRTAG